MEDFLQFAASDYGFFLKMTVVACVAIIAGIMIRRRGSQPQRGAD